MTDDTLTAAVARLRLDIDTDGIGLGIARDLCLVLAALEAAQAAMPPREPTLGMLSAAQEYLEVRGEVVAHDTRISLWRRMHDAWTHEQTSVNPANRTTTNFLINESGDRLTDPLDPINEACERLRMREWYSADQSGVADRHYAAQQEQATGGPAADHTDIVRRLRAPLAPSSIELEAADALERQAREIADTRAMLQNTNRDAARLAHLADKYKWQVRDTCTRAERAEAERDALRELLRKVLHATSANMSMDMYAEVCAAIDAARAKVRT